MIYVREMIRTPMMVSTVTMTLLLAFLAVPGAALAFSHYIPHDPIYIVGNEKFTAVNGVTGGSGTPSDPFIIEGWEINASSATGIEIRDTTAHFTIRNVSVHSGGSSHFGINLVNVSHGRVENATVMSSWFGIRIDASTNITFAGNTVSSNIQSGLNLRNTSDLIVTDTNSSSNGGSGIYLNEVSNVTIAGNTASANSGSGIETHYSANVTIMDNRASSNGRIGIGAHVSTNVTIMNNTVSSNQRDGIGLQDAPNATVMSNTFTSDGLFIFESLQPSDVSSYTITPDNLVNGKPLYYYKDCSNLDVDGIPVGQLIVANCTNVRAANLEIEDTEAGIELLFVVEAVLTSNRLVNNHYGTWLMLTANVTATGNNFSSNGDAGVSLFVVGNALFTDNRISNNGNGTSLFIAGNVSFTRNDISNNGVGMRAERSFDIHVHRNNFVSNAVQAYDDGGAENSWDDGYPGGGNYWSDYTDGDNCSGPDQDVCPDPDGIGDTPYIIDSDSMDNYPLIELVSQNTPPVASFTVSLSSGDMTATFTVEATSSSDVEDTTAALEVRWDWEDDGSWDTSWSTEKTAQHQYASTGTYTIRLEVRDTGGLTDSVTKQVEVVPSDTTPPRVLHTPPGSVEVGAPIAVTATIMDEGGVDEVLLHYKGVDATTFSSVIMTEVSGDEYATNIPAQERPGLVEYYIVATDFAGNSAREPEGGAHRVDVTEETIPIAIDQILLYTIPPIVVVGAILLYLYKRRKKPPTQP